MYRKEHYTFRSTIDTFNIGCLTSSDFLTSTDFFTDLFEAENDDLYCIDPGVIDLDLNSSLKSSETYIEEIIKIKEYLSKIQIEKSLTVDYVALLANNIYTLEDKAVENKGINLDKLNLLFNFNR